MSLCVSQFFCPSIGLFCLSACPSVYFSVNISVYPSVYLSFYLSLNLPVYLSACSSVSQSDQLPACLFLSLFVCLPFDRAAILTLPTNFSIFVQNYILYSFLGQTYFFRISTTAKTTKTHTYLSCLDLLPLTQNGFFGEVAWMTFGHCANDICPSISKSIIIQSCNQAATFSARRILSEC